MEFLALVPFAIILFGAAAVGVLVAGLLGFLIFTPNKPDQRPK